VNGLLPELRRRNIVKSDYRGTTLRENFELPDVVATKAGSTPHPDDETARVPVQAFDAVQPYAGRLEP
jgi:hypothetical protein